MVLFFVLWSLKLSSGRVICTFTIQGENKLKLLTKNEQHLIGVYLHLLFWTFFWWYIGSKVILAYNKESVYIDLILGAWRLALFAAAAIEWPIIQYMRHDRAKLLREEGLDENYQPIR